MNTDWTPLQYIGHKNLFKKFGDDDFSIVLVGGASISGVSDKMLVIPYEVGSSLLKDDINIGSTEELKNSLIFSNDDSENGQIKSHILSIDVINDNDEKFRVLNDQKALIQSKETGINVQSAIMHHKYLIFKEIVGVMFFGMVVGLSTSFFISGSKYEYGFFVGLPIAILLGYIYMSLKKLENKINLVKAQVFSFLEEQFYIRKIVAEKWPLLRIFWDNELPEVFSLIPVDNWKDMYSTEEGQN